MSLAAHYANNQILPFDYTKSVFLGNNLIDVILQVRELFDQFVFDSFLNARFELSYAGHTRVFKSKWKQNDRLVLYIQMRRLNYFLNMVQGAIEKMKWCLGTKDGPGPGEMSRE